MIDDVRPTEQDREQTITQLKSAYVNDSLGREELDRRVGLALTTSQRRVLTEAVNDLPGVVPPAERQPSLFLSMRGAMVAAVAVVALVGIAAAVPSTDAPEQGVCTSTGLSSEELPCPAPGNVQEEIIQRAAVADSAAVQAHDLAVGAPADSPVAAAAEAAQDAAGRSRRAVTDAQAVMADSLGEKPATGAFDQPAKDARKAARDAVRALQDAETQPAADAPGSTSSETGHLGSASPKTDRR